MSKKYIPLYTKYRPMIFSDITGQESTVKALSNAIKSGRIMHAYLFCGPRGTGKTSSARIFAKSLNCVNGPTVEPCGKCPGCLDVINSTPVDVIEIDAASNRGVDDARAILEKIQYAPMHGKYKIYIIDEVHMLTVDASNTLLKTLEEPPENVIFILATTESHKVLETIVSRCQRYDFRRITTDDIVKRLTYIAKSEKIQIENDALVAIAKSSAGGMRDAVALLDQLSVLGQDNTITVDDVNEILGRISYDLLYQLAECFHQNNSEDALKILNDINDRGNEPLIIISSLIQYFRDMLVLKSCSDKNLVYSLTQVNEVIYDKISAQSSKFDNQTILAVIDKLTEYFSKIRDNANKFMWAELCIIDLTSGAKSGAVSELEDRIARLEQMISGVQVQPNVVKPIESVPVVKVPQPPKPKIETIEKPLQEPAPAVEIKPEQPKGIISNTEKAAPKQTEAAETTRSDDTEDTLAVWRQLTAEIRPPAQQFFSHLAKPLEINSHKIVICVSNDILAKQANDASKKNQLTDAACRYFDVSSIQVEIKIGNYAALSKTKTAVKAEVVHAESKSETSDPQKKNEKSDERTVNEVQPPVSEKPVVDKPAEIKQENNSSENVQPPEQKTVSSPAYSQYDDISDTAKNILELFDGKFMDI
ncbi:MAG: DNA polymerase III subunit gamma/tau [Candidatus Gastranaerophilales bacterium]|nr:DNA polymerase III subunit gamma/tau [Candidatus Gastranaerophilales bacterium]